MTTEQQAARTGINRERSMPGSVRAAIGEDVPVSFRVNGTDVAISVPARTTLADVLRDNLGLTGTHLGCEHGVCGMCTIVVDGEAARACLLFAVQCEGTDILTIEGLGAPDHQHPLQQAFSHHHALQCGFCTPGMVMSSFDLLTNNPTVPEAELPEQMSGVLCRCTGYRNILAAVSDVQARFPEGIPGPQACGARTLVGRRNAAVTGAEAGATAASPAPERTTDIVLPSAQPSVVVELTNTLTADITQVWGVLRDIETLARCLPGAQLNEALGADKYRGLAKVSLGPIKLAFEGLAQVVESNEDTHSLRVIAQGSDRGGNRSQAAISLRAEPAGQTGTTLYAEASVFLSGRIAQFGRALAGDVSRQMFKQFTEAVDAVAQGATPSPPDKSPSALRLAASVMAATLRRVFGRVFRTGSRQS